MKLFMRNPRTGLPTLAVLVALVLSFAVPPFNSVIAAGSSDAFFNLAAVVPASVPTTAVVTPIATTSSGGGGGGLARTGMNLFALFLLALMAIALGTYMVASERSLPVLAGAGFGPTASTV